MRKQFQLTNLLFILLLTAWSVVAAPQQSTEVANLAKEIFSPAKILGINFYQKDISGYSTIDLEGVQSARNAFSSFLVDIQKQNNAALALLTDDLKVKYKSPEKLYDYLAGDSEGIIEFKIFDFDYLEKKKVLSIRYDLTTTTEGTICITQHSVDMQLVAGQWKIRSLH